MGRKRVTSETHSRPITDFEEAKIVWFEFHPPPYICEHCIEDLEIDDLVIHHRDHDPWNNDLNNFMPLHRRCHPSVHNVGMKRTIETRNNIVNGLQRYYENETDVQRDRRRDRHSGPPKGHKKHSTFGDLQRQAQLTTRMRTCECGLQTNAGSMARHQRARGHVNISW